MKITKSNNTVELFRKACDDAGYKIKDTDKQLQYMLNQQQGEVTIRLDKDGKTIIGYKYQGKPIEKKKSKQ
jgi:hypothetical protein